MKYNIKLLPNKFQVLKIKHFHPSGQDMPDTHYFAKGGFSKECIDNENAYALEESVHPHNNQHANGHIGGIITFPADQFQRHGLFGSFFNHFKKEIFHRNFFERLLEREREVTVDFSDGEIFKGFFINRQSEEIYNEKSSTLEISGLSSKELLALVKCLFEEYPSTTEVLVNDLNKREHYLVSLKKWPSPSNPSDASVAEKISKFFEEYECAVIQKASNQIGTLNDSSYSGIVTYAQSDEFKRIGFVPQIQRRSWNRKLNSCALKLRYAVADTENAFILVNVNKNEDFFKNTQRLAKAFNRESIIVKDAGTQEAFRLVLSNGDSEELLRKVSIGKMVENIQVGDIARRAFSKFNPKGYLKDSCDTANDNAAIRYSLETWEGRNSMGKYGISISSKDIMEELGF